PELPEVEVVRRGLARWLIGARIGAVDVLHPRPVRRHEPGPADFAARLCGATVLDAVRRGKFLWLPLDSGEALLAHLGMSGQLLLTGDETPDERHLRVRIEVVGAGPAVGGPKTAISQLRFVDQRMFGGLAVAPLVSTPDGLPAGIGGSWQPSAPELPPAVAHIARDPLDPHLDEAALVHRLRGRRTGIKRALLDQTLLSGVGNIYADEALWRARLHYARTTSGLTRPAATRLLAAVREVMGEALVAGGTSFDSLYVNVNGESGYFDRSLAVYGQGGRPCPRCGTPIRRDAFMNRSSFSCPRCQPRPRDAHS
ncbi:MAG TPA: bifunctional DNA-formamidopyrimidine glycosylase/DNA-(apurinic or apyrimidinic site) lyase, partial [Kineosporiaceae bacterium]|nr:bifunctional DNA-formamidopyrimidine glycosylase/DNA-(apurinic or apyrimidinic site) lyase [Kineosporiaceae bacterium]